MMTTTITTTQKATIAQQSKMKAVTKRMTPNFRKTRPEYLDSFDGEPLEFESMGTSIKAWNVKGELRKLWSSLQRCLVDMLEQQKSSDHLQPPIEFAGHSTPVLQLRCFLVGYKQSRASPHVAVCCGYRWYADGIRALIVESQILGNGLFKHFKACFVMVADIIQPGPPAGSAWGSLPPNLTELNFALHPVDKPHGTLCGAKVTKTGNISQSSTIGGVVQIGRQCFGLTVAHILETDPRAFFLPESKTHPQIVDLAQLDLVTSDEEESDSDDSVSTPSQSPTPSLPENAETTTLKYANPNFDAILCLSDSWISHGIENSGVEYSRVKELSRGEDGTPAGRNLDWALMTIENPRLRQPNTIYPGGLPSLKLMNHVPSGPDSVLLKTSHGPLIGSGTLSISSLKIPTLGNFQIIWTLRISGVLMGDCGSWAFENRAGGNLIGMLIAACPELEEAYVLPACLIFRDIEIKSGMTPILPGSGAEAFSTEEINITSKSRVHESSQGTKQEFMQPTEKNLHFFKDIGRSYTYSPSNLLEQDYKQMGKLTLKTGSDMKEKSRWQSDASVPPRYGGGSAVHVDPTAMQQTSKFTKHDVVHMSIITHGIRTKGTFTVSKCRFHPSGGFYEYQLIDSVGKLHENGAWIREKNLRKRL